MGRSCAHIRLRDGNQVWPQGVPADCCHSNTTRLQYLLYITLVNENRLDSIPMQWLVTASINNHQQLHGNAVSVVVTD